MDDKATPIAKDTSLVRGVGLLQATSANMLNMIGIGPFITIPIMIGTLGGPHAMIGWILGAIISMCDGLVWAELGAAMPGSGGPYVYLQQAYGPDRLGRLMSFLYIWQTIFIAPLSIASGAVGFALYTKYFWPTMTPWETKLMAAGLCLFVTALLYRDIRGVGRLAVGLWVVVMLTVAWIVISGLIHFQPRLVMDIPPDAFRLSKDFIVGLGGATLIAMYSYGGYFNVCLFGGEVKDPGRTIPRSILLAIVVVALLYITMSVTIIGVIPWREAMQSPSVVSDFIEKIYGPWAGKLVTGLILWTSLGSVFAIVLGYSRVPYAAAVDGRFFKPFARVHPTKRFPSFSLVTIGVTAALACWFTLDEIIKALLVIQIIIQYIAQVIAVTMIRRFRPDIERPFRMWLYPLPSLIALGGWLYILLSSGLPFIFAGLTLLVVGIGAYLWLAHQQKEWPFAPVAVPEVSWH
ncbi:MAG TPA: amino acid permease [Blastocatellia bacterium]|nr:amino acid permease [Blastocatellia bacterium]